MGIVNWSGVWYKDQNSPFDNSFSNIFKILYFNFLQTILATGLSKDATF